MNQLEKFLVVLLVSVTAVVLNTMTIFWLWNWIVVKIFGAYWLTFSQAFAIGVIMSFLKSKREVTTLKDDQTKIELFIDIAGWSVTNSLFFLALGWIVSQFI